MFNFQAIVAVLSLITNVEYTYLNVFILYREVKEAKLDTFFVVVIVRQTSVNGFKQSANSCYTHQTYAYNL